MTGNFYTAILQDSPHFRDPGRIAAPDHLEPITRAAVAAIIAEAAAMGTPLLLFETYRSEARQRSLFLQHATQLETVGVHHWGLAADLVKSVAGEPSWEGDFGFLGILARKHGLISGLDWGEPGIRHSFIDACHVQRIRVADQARLFAGAWYPDDAYSPWPDVTAA